MSEFHESGFCVVHNVVSDELVARLVKDIDSALESRKRTGYALRHLAQAVPSILELSRSDAIRKLVSSILGDDAVLVRSLFFDKTAEANWKVAWHQDLTVVVRKKIDVPDFGPWSIKDGLIHVQPPARVLEQILTVRLHLDDCDANNGALQVLPGSHRSGKLDADSITVWRNKIQAVTVEVPSGGALLMRPLLLHASSAARTPRHRRVIHLEFSNALLPGGLQWV